MLKSVLLKSANWAVFILTCLFLYVGLYVLTFILFGTSLKPLSLTPSKSQIIIAMAILPNLLYGLLLSWMNVKFSPKHLIVATLWTLIYITFSDAILGFLVGLFGATLEANDLKLDMIGILIAYASLLTGVFLGLKVFRYNEHTKVNWGMLGVANLGLITFFYTYFSVIFWGFASSQSTYEFIKTHLAEVTFPYLIQAFFILWLNYRMAPARYGFKIGIWVVTSLFILNIVLWTVNSYSVNASMQVENGVNIGFMLSGFIIGFLLYWGFIKQQRHKILH